MNQIAGHLLFLSERDPTDALAWSGIPQSMHRAFSRLWKRFSHLQIPFDPTAELSLALAQSGAQATAAAQLHQPDLIVCQGNSMIPQLQTDRPVVCWHDASWYTLLGLPLPLFRRRHSDLHAWDHQVLERVTRLYLASEWARSYTALAYPAFQHKLGSLPFGPNLPVWPTDTELAQWRQERVQRKTCRLLFIGKDWERKGLLRVLELVRRLQALNYPVRLDIVGCQPNILLPEGVYVQGFLNKSTPQGWAAFSSLLSQADFLVHPAQRECYGCVLVEAGAFGVPGLVTAVEGLPSIVQEGFNGYLAQSKDFTALMSAQIIRLKQQPADYLKLSEGSVARAHDLSWEQGVYQLAEQFRAARI